MTSQQIREYRPTWMFATVDYTEPYSRPTSKAKVRASYRATNLRVEYGSDAVQTLQFTTGDFEADWNALVEFIRQVGGDDAHVMCSSTVDHYMMDGGYTEL